MIEICAEGTCTQNSRGACFCTDKRKDSDKGTGCPCYEGNGKHYCETCSPIMTSTEKGKQVPYLNICSPVQRRKAYGHKFCFNCGRNIENER